MVESVFGYSRDASECKFVETTLGFSLVWFVAGTLQAIFLAEAQSGTVRSRTPRLLVDIVRLCFVVIGMVMVYSGVWHKDVSPLLNAPRTATVRADSEVVAARRGKSALSNLFSERSDLL